MRTAVSHLGGEPRCAPLTTRVPPGPSSGAVDAVRVAAGLDSLGSQSRGSQRTPGRRGRAVARVAAKVGMDGWAGYGWPHVT